MKWFSGVRHRLPVGFGIASLLFALATNTGSMSADRFRIAPAIGDTDPRWDARILNVLVESSRLVE